MNESVVYSCDNCGKKDLVNYKKCDKHEFILCDKCSISNDNKILCPEDVREQLPISRDQFKILIVVVNNIVNEDTISEITKIPVQKVSKLIKILSDLEILNHSQATGLVLSVIGFLAIKLYSQFFGEENEMKELDEEIIKYVKSR